MATKSVLPYLSKLHNECRVILASGSPRRKELLQLMGIKEFTVLVSNFPENLDIKLYSPQEYCLHTAQHKIEDVIKQYLSDCKEKTIVIGADTIVEIDGHVLEKPKDEQDAKRMISMLSGRQHFVHTSVTIYSNFPRYSPSLTNIVHNISFTETTKVNFSALTEADIDAYVVTKEGMDKAGSYGIQGYGGQLVSGVEGCYFNVMGLPVHTLSCNLAKILAEDV